MADNCEYEIQEVPIENSRHVDAQRKLSVNSGLGFAGNLLLGNGMHVRHNLQTWIYQPGYRTVHLSHVDKCEWSKQVDLNEQITDLISICSCALKPKTIPVSPEHRKVLQFLASECDRLEAMIEIAAVKEGMERQAGGDKTGPDELTQASEAANNPGCVKLREIREKLLQLAEKGKIAGAQKNIASAKNAEEAGQALKERLEHAGRKGLPDLMNDSDTTLALAAAWEHFIGPGTKDTRPMPKDFVKFFEAKTGSRVPGGWEREVVLAGLNVSPDSSQLRTAAEKDYMSVADFTQTTGITLTDGTYVITEGLTTVRVRQEDLTKFGNLDGIFKRIEAHVGQARTFIAICDDSGAPFPVICVNSQTGAVLWQATVWPTRSTSATFTFLGGLPRHYFAFDETKNMIAVFGCALRCFAAGFDVRNGDPIFQFTTDHWWFPLNYEDLAKWRRNLRP